MKSSNFSNGFGFVAGVAALAASALVLSGCASGPGASPTPTSSSSASAVVRGTDPLAEIKVAAITSCDKATNQGVVETVAPVADGSAIEYWLMMIPKAEAVNGFSAARYSAEIDIAQAVFETYEFDSCYLSMQFGLAEEAGSDISQVLDVTYDKALGAYVTVQSPDGGAAQTAYYFVDAEGFFEKVQYVDAGEVTYQRNIEYRALNEQEQAWFTQAIESVG